MPSTKFDTTVEVKQNLHIVMRERGKIVERRDGHNIWLDLGREYLASLIAYASFSPLTPERNDRVQYMGLGIGGNAQISPGVANVSPLVLSYPGSNAQTDTDPTVVRLERPVRVTGGANAYPGTISDVWLGQVQAPAVHSTATSVTFARLFGPTDISYDPFLVVPVSEVMLFTAAANPNLYNNTGIAYDVFQSLGKTTAFSLEVSWTILF